jgi:hypothetical protein
VFNRNGYFCIYILKPFLVEKEDKMLMYESAQILQNQLSAGKQDVIELFGVSSA